MAERTAQGAKQNLPILLCPDRAAWETWLAAHHAEQAGVWLKLAKKSSPRPTVRYAEAVETALCYGWIDGQVSRLDEHFYLQRFTPRTPKSKWSQVNRAKATALIDQGRMRPAGLAKIEEARADGRWEDAYAPPSRVAVPEDFQDALDAHPKAKAFFDTLTSMQRFAFLFRLHQVKRPEVRAARIAGYIARLSRGQTL